VNTWYHLRILTSYPNLKFSSALQRAPNSAVLIMLALAVVALMAGADLGLRDHAISSSGLTKYLDGNWTAHTGAGPSGEEALTIPSTVPGQQRTTAALATPTPLDRLACSYDVNSALASLATALLAPAFA